MNIYFLILVVLLFSFLVLRKTKENFQENEKKFLFIHIPKTAGNSFIQSFNDFKSVDHFKSLNHSYKNINKKKVTIVRNPYERCLSAYLYLKKGGMKNNIDLNYQKQLIKYKTYKDFLKDLNNLTSKNNQIIHLVPQYKFIEDESGILIDNILYLENIDYEIKELCKKLNIKCPSNFKKENTNKHNDYKTYYDKETQDLVYNFYKRDFELLGYNYNL